MVKIFYPMPEDFSFAWNGKKWNGFINTLSAKHIYIHFEEHELRDLFKGSLKMKQERQRLFSCKANPSIHEQCPRLYESILKAVAQRVKAKLVLH